jgi:Glutamine amidotransferase domain/Asparagine synthase
MSGIIGVFGAGDGPSNSQIRTMLHAMSDRGSDVRGLWRGAGGVLGAVRHRWECDQEFSGHVTVVEDEHLVVAADATIYYQDDLLRALGRAPALAGSENPSRLILWAFRAWGPRFLEHLEGDFAFVLFDRRSNEYFFARDFAGSRPLFHTEIAGSVVVASSIGAILAYPGSSDEIDLAAIAEAASGLHSSASHLTCYKGIKIVPAGHCVRGRVSGSQNVAPFWQPTMRSHGGRLDDTARELRELLCRAVAERLPRNGAGAALGLSDDWRSAALFGAGQFVLKQNGKAPKRLLAVSIPNGNGGKREKGLAARWNSGVHWLDRDTATTLEYPAQRFDPLVLGFESHTSALVRGCRSTGARVILDGTGGDRLFAGSDILAPDNNLRMWGRGRWIVRLGERGLAVSGIPHLMRWTFQPAWLSGAWLTSRLLRRGRSTRHPLSDAIPAWIEPTFAKQHHLLDRSEHRASRPYGTTPAEYELLCSLTTPANGRLFSAIQSLGVSDGLEARFPLFDRRVAEFMAGRPPIDRADAGRLLGRALHGFLPEDQSDGPPAQPKLSKYVERVLAFGISIMSDRDSTLALADAGIIQPEILLTSVRRYRRTLDQSLGLALYRTFQTELWYRAKVQIAAPEENRPVERRIRRRSSRSMG